MSQLAEIVTIGVHGFDEAGFFDALAAANVDTVCDVRARRGMRGAPYAFANSLRLQESLRTHGYAYVHAKELAPSPTAREAQVAADAATGEAKRGRSVLGAAFGDVYRREALAGLDADDIVAALPEITSVVAPVRRAASQGVPQVPSRRVAVVGPRPTREASAAVKVVIAARTRMQTGVCVGAVCMRDGRALRLLTRTGDHQPEDSPYEVGFAWEIDCKPKSDPEPPHIEDVRVFRKWRVDYVEDLGAYLAANTDVWGGGPDALFGGLLRISERGRGYIARDVGLPDRSTGFWRPDVAMEPVLKGKRVYFAYASEGVDLVVPYFGTAEPPESIPADALVRVSLSRWYAPTENEDEKCWLQLSGVY